MVTENNSLINYFTGGMNSDSGIEDIKENQYIEARNIRITKYSNGYNDKRTNLQELIRPIEGVEEQDWVKLPKGSRIIAQGAIKDYGIVITQERGSNGFYGGSWSVYRFEVGDGATRKLIHLTKDPIFGPAQVEGDAFKIKPTIHFRYEDEDNIKLYILDNIHPMMVLNIAPSNDSYNRSLNGDVDKIMSYPKVTFNLPEFLGYIAGKLKPSIVSYSYLLYNKHGISTDISPACKFIPVGNYKDDDKKDINGVKGSLQDKETNTGCSLRIKLTQNESYLDKLRIYRITYQQNGQVPTVDIIYQGDWANDVDYNYYFCINDNGQDPLQSITVEEYNSMSGVHIIPRAIESKDNYMFAANVTDLQTALVDAIKNYDTRAFRFNSNGQCSLYSATGSQKVTITSPYQANNNYSSLAFRDCYNPNSNVNLYPDNDELYDLYGYYGGSGVNISWRFVVTQNIEDANIIPSGSRDIGTVSNYIKKQNLNSDKNNIDYANCCTKSYFIKRGGKLEYIRGLHPNNIQGYWKNPYIIKSLRRDEVYRYGIILYDKYGKASPVKWIADIRTPNLYTDGFETFASHTNMDGTTYELATRPLGVAFNVRNLPSECTAYEIVRCTRTANDIASVSQGVISRPVIGTYRLGDGKVHRNIYNPTGFLTTADVCEGFDALSPFCKYQKKDYYCMSNIFNYNTFLFASPEVCYQSESIQLILKDKLYKLLMLTYLFGTRGDKLYKDTMFDNKLVRGGDNGSYSTLSSPTTFISPSISNTNVEIVNGSCSGGMWIIENTQDGKTMYTELKNQKNVVHLDSRYQRDYFLKLTPQSYTYISNPNSFTDAIIAAALGKWSTAKPKQVVDNLYNTSLIAITDKDRAFNIYDEFDLAEMTAFSYIKLYEQSSSALMKLSYINDKPVFAKAQRLMPEQTHTDIKIKDLLIADNIAWNKIWNEVKTDKDNDYTTEYQNTLSSVGDSMYCNFVSGGLYGGTYSYIKEGLERHPVWTSGPSSKHCCMYGLGGTTALLYLDNDTISQISASDNGMYSLPSTTVGACTYKTFDQSLNSSSSSVSATWNAGGSRSIVKDSILGTYLCNIRKEVVPYGGYDYATKNLNVYYTDGDYFLNDDTEWNCVFNGDVYIGTFEYVSMHKYWLVFDNNGYYPNTHCIIYSIPVETSINLNFTQGYLFSKDADDGAASFIQEEPSTVIENYVQKLPLYVYNTAYSAESRVRVQPALDLSNIDDYNKNIEYRCYYSNLKTNNEVIDSWTKYLSSNFIDVDSNKGAIVSLRSFKNFLVFWQQAATGLLSVNERAITTDDNSGSSIILGTGGVLSRYDYIDNTSGMDSYYYCDTQSASVLYWFDLNNDEIKCFSGGDSVIQLSKSLLVNNLMCNYRNDSGALKKLMFYDRSNSEIVSLVLSVSRDDASIAYNEQAKVFTSLYTIPFEGVSSFEDCTVLGYVHESEKYGDWLYLGLWNSIYPKYPSTWGGSTGDAHTYTYLKYAVNKQPLITKVFDNLEIVTPNKLDNIGLEEAKDKSALDIDKESYYSNNHDYTWQTDINSSKGSLKDQITLREGNYRYAIPRTEGLFGNRIRGKYMICSIQDNYPSNDAAIKYIITKFRTSWS